MVLAAVAADDDDDDDDDSAVPYRILYTVCRYCFEYVSYFHFDYGSVFLVLFQLVYQVVRNNNLFSDYEDDYGNSINDTYMFAIIFFKSVYQIMNQTHVSWNRLFYGE